ncbi:tyrosine-type recombinase/integrase [Acinetobacter modestus]|uniref:Integrase n=1 Tax=Acinetobacter modestus TaxID=1776740 RepID=A0ABN0JS07_9GAMM|nr:integrase arm-type DNA-binding domain-containing protein [Acinetobacter modestus]ENU27962.1 hypothetical protein F992_00794 [Acinetobacter modestus]GGA21419.1 integrase [Acinetobacter modestus]
MLTDAQLRRIKANPNKKTPDKYSDTNGLQLHVFPTGRKTWIYAYRYQNKQRSLTLGSYPDLSLADARIKLSEAKKTLNEGIDPNQAKKSNLTQLNGEHSFEYVAMEWYRKKVETWAASTSVKTKARLEADIFPFIGAMDIASIKAPDLLSVIKRIEDRSPDTAKRALQECGQIFRYGIALGKNENDPSQALQGLLLPVKTRNFAAITDPNKVGEFLRAIDDIPNTTLVVKSAFKLAPLFFVRIGELRKAKWSEIDFDKQEWRYFITKTKQDHIVPLSKQAIEILKELQCLTGQHEYIFVGYRNNKIPMSDGALNAAIRRLGYDTQEEITGHGFRAMARTILNEEMGIPVSVIEHQLAHKVPDSLGTAYNRTKFLEQRKKMMQQWADYLDSLKQNVIPFPKHKTA